MPKPQLLSTLGRKRLKGILPKCGVTGTRGWSQCCPSFLSSVVINVKGIVSNSTVWLDRIPSETKN